MKKNDSYEIKFEDFDFGAKKHIIRKEFEKLSKNKKIKKKKERKKIKFKIKQHSKMNIVKAMNKMAYILMDHFKIQKINGKFNVTIIWGHYKQRGRICDKLQKHWLETFGIRSLVVDESWTSSIHYKFIEDESGKIDRICHPVELKKTIGQKTSDKKIEKWVIKRKDCKLRECNPKNVKIWHLLQCKCSDDDCHKFIHRDLNGSLNILKIGLDILKYSFRFFPRYVPLNNKVLVDSSELTSASL